uniref:Acyl_transf_3 domain-containing protein n=1 Tax=Angiostrongylus cantonensis TaxID=6313 RepID=A0A0K0D0T4_ANGCA
MAEAVRLDLQGLRGVAVISVLVFHFFPERFPNGYVGVDQFFVLSGFLIAMILDRDDCLSKSVLYEFYYRRIKRIVPLYLLVILLTLVLSFIIFPLSSLSVNLASAKVALVFLSNIWPSPAASNSYYSMVSPFCNLSA